MSKKLSVIFLVLSFFFPISGQDTKEESYTIWGYIRSRHETDLANNSGKFLIEMSRVGIRGKISDKLSYRLMVDFSRLGQLKTETTDINGNEVVTDVSATFSNYLVDAYGAFEPVKELVFQVGQFKVPFSTENLLPASDIPFVNRSLLRTYSAPGLRDIGGMVSYKLEPGIPINLNLGLFNGSGQNKEEDDRTVNYASRIVINPIKELNLTGNYYSGRIKNIKTSFWDIGVEYNNSGLWAAAEYASKESNLPANNVVTNSYFLYALYDIVVDNKLIPIIQPGFRVESADLNNDNDDDEITKYTLGLTFVLTSKKQTHIRINYEKFDMANGSENPDRFILEFQVKF